eukprot:106619-Alexandrium_andersonii.AAC.1
MRERAPSKNGRAGAPPTAVTPASAGRSTTRARDACYATWNRSKGHVPTPGRQETQPLPLPCELG